MAHLEQLRIRGFGCIEDATLALTPLHAIVGPSDAGKTTVLRALRALSRYAQQRNPHVAAGEFTMYGREHAVLEVRASDGAGGAIVQRTRSGWGEHHVDDEVRDALGGHHMLRLQPEALRQASLLIPEGSPVRFVDEGGHGLPALYDAILSRDVASYVSISARLTKLFPAVRSVSLVNPDQQTKALGVLLHDGTFVSSSAVSDGLLRWLAFATVTHLSPAALLLVEEPENGLHPAAIADVLGLLRDVAKKVQVVMTTHSPFVVSELDPDEVTVLRRDPSGTLAVPLRATLSAHARGVLAD